MGVRISRRLVSFTIVGAAGFVVDVLALHLAMRFLGAGLYFGRVLSYLTTATFTWALNRRFTFRDSRSDDRLAEWARFLAANSIGGLANYGTYALLVTVFPLCARYPVFAVAAGSLMGLAINFSLSSRMVFSRGGPR